MSALLLSLVGKLTETSIQMLEQDVEQVNQQKRHQKR